MFYDFLVGSFVLRLLGRAQNIQLPPNRNARHGVNLCCRVGCHLVLILRLHRPVRNLLFGYTGRYLFFSSATQAGTYFSLRQHRPVLILLVFYPWLCFSFILYFILVPPSVCNSRSLAVLFFYPVFY